MVQLTLTRLTRLTTRTNFFIDFSFLIFFLTLFGVCRVIGLPQVIRIGAIFTGKFIL